MGYLAISDLVNYFVISYQSNITQFG